MMPPSFKTVALVARPETPHLLEALIALTHGLEAAGYRVLVDKECLCKGKIPDALDLIDRQALGEEADVAVVLGGDGTMLGVARLLAPYSIPLIGVNQGRLGFMTDIPLHSMEADILAILAGEFIEENRMLVECTLFRAGERKSRALAFNDVVLNRGTTGSMIEFEVFIDEQFVCSQRADGLIVATPTGSTAYSLASGGPILHPTVPAMAIVPICPQSLSNRPLVVGSDAVLECVLTKGPETRIHFDGQLHWPLKEFDRVLIHRYRNPLRLLHPLGYHYYDMLRKKLHWGEKLL